MSLVFIPRTVADVARVVPWEHPGNALFRFYPPFERGISVWVLADGSMTEQQPPNNEGVVRVYLGGHEYPVTSEEAAALTFAGYGDRIIER